ncbi:MAG: hypothetical protein ACKOWE_00975 [Micrococcales bacterium]
MQPLPADVIRDCLSNAIARRLKEGWQVVATGETVAYLGRAKAKHNGMLGAILLAPFSLGLSVAWAVLRNLDTKSQGLKIEISIYDAVITETWLDYEQMVAQLSLPN